MSFQEKDVKELQINPWKAIGDEWMLVTAEKDGKVNTMTASWGGVGIMWGKPTATVYLRPQRYTKEFVDAGEIFTLSFFGGQAKKAMGYLGSVSGRDEADKIVKSGLHVTEQMRMDILRQARGEAYPRGRSKLSLSLVFALTALLLAATAYAAVRFGVLAFHEEQAENETYLQHIQEIDEHVAGEYASVTVNDAVFDGSSLSLALDIRCADGTTPVFLYPRLRAQSEGQALGTQVHGFQIAAENHSMAASSIGMDACDGISILMPPCLAGRAAPFPTAWRMLPSPGR